MRDLILQLSKSSIYSTKPIELLVPFLDSDNAPLCNWAKAILANHFLGLWSYAGCFDILENIVRKYGAGGKWPDMWTAIKRTIHYNGKKHAPELLKRIEALEHLAAPADPYFEIEAYALTNIWDHVEVRGGSDLPPELDTSFS
ncbi:hypothetical protein [Klebsiella pneumoniae]|uniref:hypothetical protein n=1 Tax=Klebsiella pneumoniae TaxID=573 RepID=UPI0024068465|nr:hypothetical protein [Klebsiella pneumoniae]MDG0584914.1 hypothetical protein [Klebsiella pneumoniae]